MRDTLQNLMRRVRWGKAVSLALAAGAIALAANPAHAGRRERMLRDREFDGDALSHGERDEFARRERRHHGDENVRVDIDLNTGRTRVGQRQWCEPRYEERQVRVWVDPVYRTVSDRIWVEPVFKTVNDRVWREPVVRTESERVWVPARYEWQVVTRRDDCGRLARVKERVQVAPGRFEERWREVVVRPGGWENTERRELVCEGRWEHIERQELISEGHYEWRTERVKVADGGWRDETAIGFELRF